MLFNIVNMVSWNRRYTMTKILSNMLNLKGDFKPKTKVKKPPKQIHLKRVLATYWKDNQDHSKGIERLEHLFVSIDKELWEEINTKVFSSMTIDDYEEVKELFDVLSIKIGNLFFLHQANSFINYKNSKFPKIKVLEEITIE